MSNDLGLGHEDRELLDVALKAALDGPFFDDVEFRTLMGFTRADLRRVAGNWRHGPIDETTDRVVTNVLVNLLGYPHTERDAWKRYSQTEPTRLNDLLTRWRDLPR